ncbi:GTPase Era [Haliea atlantica]
MAEMAEMEHTTRCGYVALVGRPNVGKSTLLNHLLGQKISITSRKPQTTRHQVLGIKSEGDCQVVFVDTPGLHRDEPRAINRYMNRAAASAIRDVDLVVMVADRTAWTEEDEWVLQQVQRSELPAILVLNKVDLLAEKGQLLPHLQALQEKGDFQAIIPLSALRGQNLQALEDEIAGRLPEAPFFFPEEQITDRSQRFLAAEIVREKIMRQLGDELPYATTVEIEDFAVDGGMLHIHALILVERSGQKRIIIGDKGSRLKAIGSEARRDMERLFDSRVMLNLWVKVKSGWSDDDRALRSLGYDDR